MPDYPPGSIYRNHLTSTGQTMDVSTGATIKDFNVAKSTAGSTTIKNHGVTFINTTHTRVIQDPVKGSIKTLIFHGTTKPMVVRTALARINNTTDRAIQVTLTSATGKLEGYEVRLYGLSTTRWLMGGAPNMVTLKLSSST